MQLVQHDMPSVCLLVTVSPDITSHQIDVYNDLYTLTEDVYDLAQRVEGQAFNSREGGG